MRRKSTKEYLAESFLELAEKEPVAKITITDIASNCDFSQPTFYNHFKDKYDLIYWIAKKNASEMIPADSTTSSVETVIDGLIKAGREHRQMVINLADFVFVSRILYRQVVSAYAETVCDRIRRERGLAEVPMDIKLLVETFLIGVSTILIKWLVDEMPYSEEGLKSIMIRSVPEDLKYASA
jgi:AcrR family transcriptional regulator